MGSVNQTVRSGTEWFPIDDPTATGAVRRAAMNLGRRLGMGEHRVAEIGIVATEATSNLANHADDATIGLQVALRHGEPGVQIIAVDHGPGMHDLTISSADGHSTSGTLGVGLGAIERLSTSLDMSSRPGRGTVLVATMWPSPGPIPTDVDVGGVVRPMAGEQVCGDAVAGRALERNQILLLVDGLGHGPLAAVAAQEALTAFYGCEDTEPHLVLTHIHRRLAHTRGVAAAVVTIDASFRTARMAGVGNVTACINTRGRRIMMTSYPGIVGHQTRTIRQLDFELEDDSIVILHSDGLDGHWELTSSPGLPLRSSTVIAASLLRDAATRRDDASVLVAKRPR